MQASEDLEFPREVRLFAYSMLLVHQQKLDYLVARGEKVGHPVTLLTRARDYLAALSADGPDDPAFVDWCREALEMANALKERGMGPALRVIDGGKDGG